MSADVVFLYDQVIETLTRLHSFSSAKERDLENDDDVESDIDHVAELLAKRDLLIFAASTRNFAESCKAVHEMRTIGVPTCSLLPPPVAAPFFTEGVGTLTLYQVLSRILHSNAVEICRSARDYENLSARSTEEFLRMIETRRRKPIERSEPLVVLQGEKDPFTLLRLRSIIVRSCVFLNQVSDRLSKQDRIYLQRDYRDL